MPTKRVRAAIVGGGIGGLSAANALLLRGIDVTVFEQVDTLREVGTGVSIFPNGRRQLERMGLKEALAQVGAKVGDGSEYYRMDGTVVGPILTTDSSGWNGVYGMHRADLSRVLAEALPGTTIRTAHRCVGFEQNAHVAQLKFANGMTAEADVVIGADGIQSVLQKYVVQPSLPEYSGSRAYRGLIPSTKLPEWRKEAHQTWMGDGKHFMVYPVRSGQLLNYVGFVPTTDETVKSWSAIGDRDELAASFEGWDPRVVGLLEKVDTCFWWGLYDRQPSGVVDERASCSFRRCRPCDASAPRTRRQSGDRRWRGAGSFPRRANLRRNSRRLAAIRSFSPRAYGCRSG